MVFYKKLAGNTGLSEAKAKETFKQVVETVKDTLLSGDKVTIQGFGIFEVNETKARNGRNPSTGEPLEIPPGHRLSFKPSIVFKKTMKETLKK